MSWQPQAQDPFEGGDLEEKGQAEGDSKAAEQGSRQRSRKQVGDLFRLAHSGASQMILPLLFRCSDVTMSWPLLGGVAVCFVHTLFQSVKLRWTFTGGGVHTLDDMRIPVIDPSPGSRASGRLSSKKVKKDA